MARYDYRHDTILGPVLTHWLQARAERPMPQRRDIQPKAIKQQLSHVQLIDVEDGGQKFRFRLIGSALTEIFGREVTGQYLHDVQSGEIYRIASAIYQRTCQTSRPHFLRSEYVTPKGIKVISNRVYLPLSEDGASVSMLLCAASFESPYGAKGVLADASLPMESNYQEEIDTGVTRVPGS